MAQINCIVVTPEETTLEEKADSVVIPLYDGEMGILPGHSPMIGRLGFGEMRLRNGSTITRYYVDAGFVQIDNDVISLLTNRAVPADELDAEAAQQQLDEAMKRPIGSAEMLAIRDREIDQARGQLWVARRR